MQGTEMKGFAGVWLRGCQRAQNRHNLSARMECNWCSNPRILASGSKYGSSVPELVFAVRHFWWLRWGARTSVGQGGT